MSKLFDMIFGCWHKKQSWVFGRGVRTYRVCMDCGKRIPYRIGEAV